jgi:hypothetical protein
MKNTLCIFGAGRLGQRVGALWRTLSAHGPNSQIVAITLSDRRHAELRAQGFIPLLRSQAPSEQFSNILFCIPPSQALGSYREEAETALRLWDGSGGFVMVSSTAVYAENSGGKVSEMSAVSDTPRAQVLLSAEHAVQNHNGTIVRLAGLYDAESGPHLSYQKQKTSPQSPDGYINLIHRSDAATLCIKALQWRRPGIFLGVDNCPMTRQQINLAASKILKHPPCRFEGTETSLGKQCTNEMTCRTLGWQPEWKSFEVFLKATQLEN